MSLPTQAQIQAAIATGQIANVEALFVANTACSGTMTGSVRCSHCVDTTNSTDCDYLSSSSGCLNCSGTSTVQATGMVNCTNCDKCKTCTGCTELTNCEGCTNCTGDALVTAGGGKYNKLWHCTNCVQCARCMYSVGLVNATNMIGNVQVSNADFNSAWALTGR
jgi:hypothetical protein